MPLAFGELPAQVNVTSFWKLTRVRSSRAGAEMSESGRHCVSQAHGPQCSEGCGRMCGVGLPQAPKLSALELNPRTRPALLPALREIRVGGSSRGGRVCLQAAAPRALHQEREAAQGVRLHTQPLPERQGPLFTAAHVKCV